MAKRTKRDDNRLIFWRNGRAYGDFRAYEDVGGGREARAPREARVVGVLQETYGEYISRVLASGSRLALLAKRADLRDNLGANCPPSLRGRYQAALALVEDALRESDLRDARATLDIEAAGPEDKEGGLTPDSNEAPRLPVRFVRRHADRGRARGTFRRRVRAAIPLPQDRSGRWNQGGRFGSLITRPVGPAPQEPSSRSSGVPDK